MKNVKGEWALILGASSGFGEAVTLALAKAGMNIIGVHLDRKATLPHVDEVIRGVESFGGKAQFFNANAADVETRQKVVTQMKDSFGGRKVKVLLHSLAFGTLKPFLSFDDPKGGISETQMDMTLNVMAHSLVYWIQDLCAARLLDQGSKVFAMTSAGGHTVWPTYGAVSAAKAALESHVRQLALELAPMGVAVNAIQAGVTDTPALRKIPGHEEMIEFSKMRNPSGRLTVTQDVAEAILALCATDNAWLTGNVVRVDGGEDIVG